jgi:uncharacterized membrane protein YraQ (UPF0718 family)
MNKVSGVLGFQTRQFGGHGGGMATRTAALGSAITSGEAASHGRTRTVAVALLLAIGAYFWTVSRYPALYKKYSQGTHVSVKGAITFGTVVAVQPGMPLRQRVWRTSINWLQANEIGMTFGFFFGAAALTVLATMPRRRTANAYLNSLLGAAVGMPLGVCANCVAPIGRGLYASGMSTESTLAAMFSSPTLNVVVLAMAFALFPLPIVAIKLATMFVMMFVFAPMIARWKVGPTTAGECAVEITTSATWMQALGTTAKSYAKSFWYVARVGVPLMLLSAVLGALAVETIPQQRLQAPATLGGIILVALVGTFLPVPMAFDVVIAYVAMSRGVALPYVVTILCTLGIYSVYSFLVVGKTISWKIAAAAGGAVAALGTIAGIAAIGLR